jgi:hypothetical protein
MTAKYTMEQLQRSSFPGAVTVSTSDGIIIHSGTPRAPETSWVHRSGAWHNLNMPTGNVGMRVWFMIPSADAPCSWEASMTTDHPVHLL